MAADLLTAVQGVLKRLGDVVAQDAELRLRLGALIKAVLALAEEPGAVVASGIAESAAATTVTESLVAATPAVEAQAASSPAPPPRTPTPPALPPRPPPVAEATEVLAEIERAAPAAEAFWQPITDQDVRELEERCLLKEEAARWAVQRQHLLRDGADYREAVAPRDTELIARAKALPDCFLWMIHRDGPTPKDPQHYEPVSGCFRAAAEAIRLLRDLLAAGEEGEVLLRALQLGAEAQSAVRGAIAAVGGRPDLDQVRLFHWVRATASAQQLLIPRFMRADDPSTPSAWPALLERIAQLAEEVRLGQERVRRRGKLLGKIRYHARRIADGRIADRPQAEHADDWQRIFEVTAEVLGDGLPPSNRELRDLLLPVVETLPESATPPEHFRRVLCEIDRYLASRPAPTEAAAVASFSPEVRRAAELLRGRAVVLIGGQKRPYAADALTLALELSEVVWLEGWHTSYLAFEPHIARPDVAIVLLAVRWSAHGFAEVKAFCDKYAKPLVRLPAGYNPNQVAHHILGQVGDRLAAGQPVAC